MSKLKNSVSDGFPKAQDYIISLTWSKMKGGSGWEGGGCVWNNQEGNSGTSLHCVYKSLNSRQMI